MPSPLVRGFASILDLALPATCPGCGTEGPPICDRCLPAVRVRRGPARRHPARAWRRVRRTRCSSWSGAPRSAAPPGGRSTRSSTRASAAWHSRWVEAVADALATRRRRRRGAGPDPGPRRPAERARLRPGGADRAAAAATPWRCPGSPALERRRATAPQYRLDRRHRAANVDDAFAAPAGRRLRTVRGRWVVLVDDVVTTGATLCAAAAALLDAGAVAVSASRWPVSGRGDRCDGGAGRRGRPAVRRCRLAVGSRAGTRHPGRAALPAQRGHAAILGFRARPIRRLARPRSQALASRREVNREDDRQGQEPRGPGPCPAVRGAQVRPPRAAPR